LIQPNCLLALQGAGAELPALVQGAGAELPAQIQGAGAETPAQVQGAGAETPAQVQGAGGLVPTADDQTEDPEINFNKGKNSSIISDTLLQEATSTPLSTPLPASPGTPPGASPGPPPDPIQVPQDTCLIPLITRDTNHQKYVINWDQATKQNVSVLMLWSDKQGRKSREPSPKL
jgi:hypothetical protein